MRSEYIEYMADKLSIASVDNWYNVTLDKLKAQKIPKNYTLFQFMEIVNSVIPNLNLTIFKSPHNTRKKGQNMLKERLKKIFPNLGRKNLKCSCFVNIIHIEIMEDYMHPNIIWEKTGRSLQLDIYIPDKMLAFEYQGKQHFTTVSLFSSAQDRLNVDKYKLKRCNELGITLIQIPYWWNGDISSLKSTIHSFRPNILSEIPVGLPISSSPPSTTKNSKQSSTF